MHFIPESAYIFIGGLTLYCGSLYADEIKQVTVPSNAFPMGGAVPVQIDFNSGTSSGTYCGLEINFGDGETRSIRAGLDEFKELPIKLTHAYQKPGQYTISVAGKFMQRGLMSALACGGDTKIAKVSVVDEVAERNAREREKALAAKEAELAEREAKLAQASNQLVQEKHGQALQIQKAREQEMAEQNAKLAWMAEEAEAKRYKAFQESLKKLNAGAMYVLGEKYRDAGEVDNAREIFSTLITKFPKAPQAKKAKQQLIQLAAAPEQATSATQSTATASSESKTPKRDAGLEEMSGAFGSPKK